MADIRCKENRTRTTSSRIKQLLTRSGMRGVSGTGCAQWATLGVSVPKSKRYYWLALVTFFILIYGAS